MIYLKSIAQISAQEPLSDEWMSAPKRLFVKGVPGANNITASVRTADEKIWRSVEADYGKFLSPMEGRRMGKMLKRAVATSMTCLDRCGVEHPDAIVTGTGLGCVQHSEAVLVDLCYNGDDAVKPTSFMQSTHNTISSLIGIRTRSHGYNCTYSQEGLSFENALADAVAQFRNGHISNALVSSFDEISDKYYILLEKAGYWGKDGECPAGEAAVSAFLDTNDDNAICRVHGVRLCWCPEVSSQVERLRSQLNSLLDEAGIDSSDIDFVITGKNGYRKHDEVYDRLCGKLLPGTPMAEYKHIFGESLSASALGFYAAAACFNHSSIPGVLFPESHDCHNDSCNRNVITNSRSIISAESHDCHNDSCNRNGNDCNSNDCDSDKRDCNNCDSNRDWDDHDNGKDRKIIANRATPNNILLLNHFRGMDFSLILLGRK